MKIYASDPRSKSGRKLTKLPKLKGYKRFFSIQKNLFLWMLENAHNEPTDLLRKSMLNDLQKQVDNTKKWTRGCCFVFETDQDLLNEILFGCKESKLYLDK